MDGPPPPPPPPVVASSNPTRAGLLSSIEGFKKTGLKKTTTKDRSSPLTSRTVSAGDSSPSSPSSSRAPPIGGGLNLLVLAGPNAPKLKPVSKTSSQPVKQTQQARLSVINPSPGRNSVPSNQIKPSPAMKTPQKAVTPAGSRPVSHVSTNNFPATKSVKASTPQKGTTMAPPAKTNVVSSPIMASRPVSGLGELDDLVSQLEDSKLGSNFSITPSSSKSATTPSSLTPSSSSSYSPRLTPSSSGSSAYSSPKVTSAPPAVTSAPSPRSPAPPINTYASSPTCQKCHQAITDQQCMEALGGTWHVQHWTCTECNGGLSTNFHAIDNNPYCDNCYYRRFSCHKCGQPVSDRYVSSSGKIYHPLCLAERCHKCGQHITGDIISVRALGNVYHSQCFTCAQCGRVHSDQFYEKGNQSLCLNCMPSSAPTVSNDSCQECRRNFEGAEPKITVGGSVWHDRCFRCRTCQRDIAVRGGEPTHCRQKEDGSIVCENCYDRDTGRSCFKCHQSLTGKFLEVEGRYVHSDCFKCNICRRHMGDRFFEMNGAYVCADCGGSTCCRCSTPVTGQYVEAFGKKYHTHCFKCHRCQNVLDDYFDVDGMPTCDNCAG
eukprot:TRINITY_DN19212_c0_g1_i1.p1 TRINITY_DN19212_c0_g1~~TRINITY_DN19212_c0_g1_i1.p1  ORF type:complete len:603 (-),score=47.28 TRINITY_DN19212_c0_g1_i1:22-1830(-)